MTYDTSELKKGIIESQEWLKQELTGLRTGRATPALLDSVSLEVYGSRMKLNQIASVLVEDARTLYISPYDASQVKAIEKAITLADLGVSAGSDEKGIRVSFPELTVERREQLIKVLKGKLEDARIAVRGKRADAIQTIDKKEKAGEMGEDEARGAKDEVQKLVDEANKALEEIANKKEKELTS
ncbi:ribosome recycling factor [Candidatus Kaiserbacteria bacterium CG10_big_fil_rev_8_21_14_0_10_45_20]|uniref:Ribosome-recycling factor n=1 Tax=Candidatus Kaiserbacteria bacterium CG10_big_fil_rev_8_21_14_0_10_45_20 TaxID=1974607 RepID=A0A2H0UG57_9BACT|nr:MAG: ribosome recycling factor [Candidatus Kaiserbacteria bacterium CG10_big_fil_rev_8_21_14_0_10_45_20]